MTDRSSYLGCVEWIRIKDFGSLAEMRPLYVQEERYGTFNWYPLTEDEIQERFPNRGLITWFNILPEAKKGSVWQFSVEEQSYISSNPYYDAFKVAQAPSPLQLDEVLDLRNLGNEDYIRVQMTQYGIVLDFVPSERVHLWLDELWIGPVHLVTSDQSDHWIIDPTQQKESLQSFLPPRETDVVSSNVGTRKLFLLPGTRLNRRLGLVDWASDDIVLKRVLQWLRRTDSYYIENLGLTSKAIERAVDYLDIDNKSLEIQRFRRALDIVIHLKKYQEVGGDLVESLLAIPSVAVKVNDAINAAHQKSLDDAKAEATLHIADLLGQASKIEENITNLKQEIERKHEELSAIETGIAEQRALQVAQVDALETALTQKIKEVMERPAELLANIAIYRTAFALSSTGNETSSKGNVKTVEELLPQQTPLWVPSIDTQNRLDSIENMRRTLRKAFQARNLSLGAVSALHSIFLTGAIPVLAGSDAFDTLEAYASCVAGGRWLWIPISPTMIDPGDLLGRVNPNTQHFIPHPSGLIDLLLQAQNRDDLYLVVLDGLNRTAIDTYLTPILECYQDTWRNRRKRTLSLFHQKAIAADDPYASMAQLQWPPNVLLAGTLTEGVTTVTLPLSFWASAALLHLDRFEENTSQQSNSCISNNASLASVSLETWKAWHESIIIAPSDAYVNLLETILDEGFTHRSELRKLCSKLYVAMQLWRGEQQISLDDVIIYGLIPSAISSRQTNTFLETLKSVYSITEPIQTALNLAKQVLI